MKRLAIVISMLFWVGGLASAAPPTQPGRSDAAMKAIFDADQHARAAGPGHIDWTVVHKQDAARRVQTRALLDKGVLSTGEDFEEAAIVFQHSDKPDDFLLAHTLAIVAVAKGDAKAIWIASATLDRYLMAINHKQIYGTQYIEPTAEHGWTQEPYDRTLVSDALRKELRVESQAEQARSLEEFKAHK